MFHVEISRVPDAYGGPFDIAVSEMGVAERHAHDRMTES